MQLAAFTTRPPHLIRALETLAHDHQEAAHALLEELSGITVLVARKFTNDKTADGLLEAFYLTIGCISLGISQADVQENKELSFLLNHGAEYVFQMGFRLVKELSSLPQAPLVSDFDNDPRAKLRNIKAMFSEICRVEPNSVWEGDKVYKRELRVRRSNQKVIECALWLRKNHFSGPVDDSDMDANAVIAIAVIFGILGDGRIVARTGQREIESLIHRAREAPLDIEAGWNILLESIPPEYQTILRERMEEFRNTLIRKILSKTRIKTVIAEIQNYYAGNELDIDYP